MTKHAIKTWTWNGVWLTAYSVLGLWLLSGAFVVILGGIWLVLLTGVGGVAVPDVLETLARVGLFTSLGSGALLLLLVVVAIAYSQWAYDGEEEAEQPPAGDSQRTSRG